MQSHHVQAIFKRNTTYCQFYDSLNYNSQNIKFLVHRHWPTISEESCSSYIWRSKCRPCSHTHALRRGRHCLIAQSIILWSKFCHSNFYSHTDLEVIDTAIKDAIHPLLQYVFARKFPDKLFRSITLFLSQHFNYNFVFYSKSHVCLFTWAMTSILGVCAIRNWGYFLSGHSDM